MENREFRTGKWNDKPIGPFSILSSRFPVFHFRFLRALSPSLVRSVQDFFSKGLTLSHARSGKGEGSLSSIVFGGAQLMNSRGRGAVRIRA